MDLDMLKFSSAERAEKAKKYMAENVLPHLQECLVQLCMEQPDNALRNLSSMLATKAADMESKITSSKHVLTDEEVKALFESMDDDNDGQLTQEEIIGTLLLQGINPNVAQQHALKLLEFDADENGLISLEEFRAGYRALQTHTSISDRLTHVGKETLLEEFKFIDEDGDGQLTNEELEGVLLLSGVDPNATSLLVEEFFQLTDSNRDGVIDFQEFVKRFDSMDSFGIIYGQS